MKLAGSTLCSGASVSHVSTLHQTGGQAVSVRHMLLHYSLLNHKMLYFDAHDPAGPPRAFNRMLHERKAANAGIVSNNKKA